MVSSPGANWWDYEPITVRCPVDGKIMPAEDAQDHAFDHWNDLTA